MKRDDQEKEKERQSVLGELKDEVAKLQEMKELSDAEFVKKVLEEFPPRTEKHTFESVKDKSIKNMLKVV